MFVREKSENSTSAVIYITTEDQNPCMGGVCGRKTKLGDMSLIRFVIFRSI